VRRESSLPTVARNDRTLCAMAHGAPGPIRVQCKSDCRAVNRFKRANRFFNPHERASHEQHRLPRRRSRHHPRYPGVSRAALERKRIERPRSIGPRPLGTP
jgi:hypothetical protein